MSIGGWIKHAAHKVAQGAKKAGKVAGDVLGGAVGTAVDGAENKLPGEDDGAGSDKGHTA